MPENALAPVSVPRANPMLPRRLPPADAITLKLMRTGGTVTRPADSLMGDMRRPTMRMGTGVRVSGPETLFDFFINDMPDPDIAIAADPNIDEKMRQQPDVHAAMRRREFTVASMPAAFQPSTERGIDPAMAQKAADYCNDVWRKLVNINELYRTMQSAVLRGGVGVEFVWRADSTKVKRPVEFYGIDKSRLVFDRLGNMALRSRTAPVWGEYIARALQRPIGEMYVHGQGKMGVFPCLPGHFIYHRYIADMGTWARPAGEGYQYFGRGEDTHLFQIVLFDQYAIRFWMKYMERFGIPLTEVYYPENRPPSEIKAIGRSIREEGIALLPREPGGAVDGWYKIVYNQPTAGAGGQTFADFTSQRTKPAVEKVLLGTEITSGQSNTGGYAQRVEEEDSGPQMVFAYDALNIGTTLNSQLTPAMCQEKWPGMDSRYYPVFTMAPKRQKNAKAALELLEQLSHSVPVRKARFYEIAGEEAPKEGAEGEPDEESVYQPQTGMGGSPFEGFPPAAPPLSEADSARMRELTGQPPEKKPEEKPAEETKIDEPQKPIGSNSEEPEEIER